MNSHYLVCLLFLFFIVFMDFFTVQSLIVLSLSFCGGVKGRLFQSARLCQSRSNGCCSCLCIAHVPVPKKRYAKKLTSKKLFFGSGTLVVPQQFISYFRLLPRGDVVGCDEILAHVGNPVNCTTKQHLPKKKKGMPPFLVLTDIVKPVGTKRQCNYFRINAAAC